MSSTGTGGLRKVRNGDAKRDKGKSGGITPIGLAQVQQAALLLSVTGGILAVQGDAEAAKAKKACERIRGCTEFCVFGVGGNA